MNQLSPLGKYATYTVGGIVLTTLSFLTFTVAPKVYSLEEKALALAADDIVVHAGLDEVRNNLQVQLYKLLQGQQDISVRLGRLESHWEDHRDYHRTHNGHSLGIRGIEVTE